MSAPASPAVCLWQRLIDSTACAALIGTRLAPLWSSEDTDFPRVVYTLISNDPQIHMGGGSGWTFQRVQFDIFALTSLECDDIAHAFFNRLHGFRGNITVGTDVRRFGLVKEENQRADPALKSDGSDAVIYRRSLDYFISCGESIPALTA